jgi:hypothetical protein
MLAPHCWQLVESCFSLVAGFCLQGSGMGHGAWGMGFYDFGSGNAECGKSKTKHKTCNAQLQILNLLPFTPCPMPHAPCFLS